MALSDTAYSRFIFLAKVILPLAALVLLSTIFLVSRSVDPTASIPYATVDVEQMIHDQGFTAPRYSGLTAEGTAVSFEAAKVLPGTATDDTGQATAVHMALAYLSGKRIEITAGSGTLLPTDQHVSFAGDVELRSSNGMRLRSDSLSVDLEGTWAKTDDRVRITSTSGTLTAGKMDIHITENDPDSFVADFTDGVKLVYIPKSFEDAQ